MHAAQFSIGLTGGIGCGKSLVAERFAALGASIVDTDLIAHSLTAAGGAAMPAVLAAFGAAYVRPDGALERGAMRRLVFADVAAKRRLEAILHPLIRAATDVAAAQASGSYLMFAVPLLVESTGWRQRVARILVIDCPEALQISRVMARNGLQESEVRAIMAAQAPRAVRLAAADDVLVNDGGVDTLLPKIAHLHERYLALAGAMATRRPPA